VVGEDDAVARMAVEAAWWTWQRWWWFGDGDEIKTMRVVVVLYRGGVGDVVF
ncbi:hypothetical protein Tco_1147844, partial [Tanacetum coccineum]